MASRNLTRTQSPFWSDPEVTRLIAEARTTPECRNKLAELVYRPAFRRLDKWLSAAGLKQLNLSVEEVFDSLWTSDLQTTIEHVIFRDREHFLRTVILRFRQAARRFARRIRHERTSASELTGLPSTHQQTPLEAAQFADLVDHALSAMRELESPRYEIVNLFFFEGLSIRQISGELQMASSTVHYEITRALRTLKEKLGE